MNWTAFANWIMWWTYSIYRLLFSWLHWATNEWIFKNKYLFLIISPNQYRLWQIPKWQNETKQNEMNHFHINIVHSAAAALQMNTDHHIPCYVWYNNIIKRTKYSINIVLELWHQIYYFPLPFLSLNKWNISSIDNTNRLSNKQLLLKWRNDLVSLHREIQCIWWTFSSWIAMLNCSKCCFGWCNE